MSTNLGPPTMGDHDDEARLRAAYGTQRDVLRDIVADYDRRRASRWGRFLLWLLRKTT